jgi:hypothetical protein
VVRAPGGEQWRGWERLLCTVLEMTAFVVAVGDTAILHCHSLPFLRDLHDNLAVVAGIDCQTDSVTPWANTRGPVVRSARTSC